MRLHIVKSGDVSGDAGIRGTQLLLGSEGPGSVGLEHPELASPHVVGTEFRVKAGGRGLSREEDGTREARRSWAPQSHAWPSPSLLAQPHASLGRAHISPDRSASSLRAYLLPFCI